MRLVEFTFQKGAGGHRLREHRICFLHGCCLLLFRRRGSAIGEGDDVVSLLVRGSHGALDAAVGEETSQHHVLDVVLPENKVEVSGRKPIQTSFAFDHNVFLCGCQLVADLAAPLARLEAAPFLDIRQYAVDASGKLLVVVRESDRCMNDLAPFAPGLLYNLSASRSRHSRRRNEEEEREKENKQKHRSVCDQFVVRCSSFSGRTYLLGVV